MWVISGIIATAAVVFVVIGVTQPRGIVGWLHRRHDDVFYCVDTPRRAVALTIDDGPSDAHTPAILDALRRHGGRATFFLIGTRVARHPDIVRRICADGHEPANHFYRDRPSILLGAGALERDLLATRDAIVGAGGATGGGVGVGKGRGVDIRWCRPGFGWYNARVLRVTRRHRYRLALASVYPHDTKLRSARLIARVILRRVAPGDIIVIHDRTYAADVLSRILPELARRGIDVVTLSELADK